MNKKLHVMPGQSWIDRQGEYRIVFVEDGWAMCRRDTGVPFVRTVGVIKAESGLKDASLRDEQKLTDWEFRTLHEIALGRRIKVIAKGMHRAPSTISTYRSRVLKKLGLRTNADMVLFVAAKAKEARA